MRSRWAPYEAKHRKRFEEIKKLSYYEMRDAMLKFADAYFADIKAAELDVAGATWSQLARSGLAYEVTAYFAEVHRKLGIRRKFERFDPYYMPIADDTVAA